MASHYKDFHAYGDAVQDRENVHEKRIGKLNVYKNNSDYRDA